MKTYKFLAPSGAALLGGLCILVYLVSGSIPEVLGWTVFFLGFFLLITWEGLGYMKQVADELALELQDTGTAYICTGLFTLMVLCIISYPMILFFGDYFHLKDQWVSALWLFATFLFYFGIIRFVIKVGKEWSNSGMFGEIKKVLRKLNLFPDEKVKS